MYEFLGKNAVDTVLVFPQGFGAIHLDTFGLFWGGQNPFQNPKTPKWGFLGACPLWGFSGAPKGFWGLFGESMSLGGRKDPVGGWEKGGMGFPKGNGKGPGWAVSKMQKIKTSAGSVPGWAKTVILAAWVVSPHLGPGARSFFRGSPWPCPENWGGSGVKQNPFLAQDG